MAYQRILSAPSTSTDALFRDWGSKLCAAMEALGVTKTADTGQIDWATVAKPATYNTYVGYEIRKFTDGLQAGDPIFIRIDFGAGAYAQTIPSVKIQVGPSTDGAGTLTGSVSTLVQFGGTDYDNTNQFPTFVSSDGGRINLALWVTDGKSFTHSFWIERLKDASGAAITGGVNICYGGQSSSQKQQFLPTGGSAYPAAPLANFNCAIPELAPCTYNENIGFFPVYVYRGYTDNPDLGACVYDYKNIDTSGTLVTLNIYGANHTYVLLGNISTTVNGRNYSSVAVRCE